MGILETAGPADATAGPGVVRPFRPGEEVAILDLMLAALARGEFDGVAPHHLESATGRLPNDPGCCAVAEVDGRLAGWVIPSDNDVFVAPAVRRLGIGTRLVEAGRAIAAAEGRADLRLWVPHRPGPEAFAGACGLRYRSSLWRMRLADGARPGAPRFPEGFTSRAFGADVDEDDFAELVTTSFADHPSPFRLSGAEVRRIHDTPGFDPGTVLLLIRPGAGTGGSDRMIGFCRVARYADADGLAVGEIRLVGVRREQRGRGLGRALTAWGIEELRRRGAETVVLAVEGENETAIGLYRDMGFGFDVEWPHWAIPTSGTS